MKLSSFWKKIIREGWGSGEHEEKELRLCGCRAAGTPQPPRELSGTARAEALLRFLNPGPCEGA